MKKIILLLGLILSIQFIFSQSKIDRKAVVYRNDPHIQKFDSLSSLSVGNGDFAMTVDATGLQSFPALYTQGVPLGTESQWGWHSFANPNHYRHEETLKNYNFKGKEEPYATEFIWELSVSISINKPTLPIFPIFIKSLNFGRD